METPGSLANLFTQAAIVLFLVVVGLFIVRTLMLPLGVILLSMVRGEREARSERYEPPSSDTL